MIRKKKNVEKKLDLSSLHWVQYTDLLTKGWTGFLRDSLPLVVKKRKGEEREKKDPELFWTVMRSLAWAFLVEVEWFIHRLSRNVQEKVFTMYKLISITHLQELFLFLIYFFHLLHCYHMLQGLTLKMVLSYRGKQLYNLFILH